ncbi:MAG: DNA primase [Clostridiales bacterium]|nr:DNA primase [Clostridiales bacterium]MBR5041444.1 DNA primase [Clostridiales bacterium]
MSTGRGGIPNEVVEEIISRSDIASVVGQYVQFTKTSGNNLFGLCPFHSEDTPSFSVSTSKQMFYCFGCHKGGDVVTFIKEIEHLSYVEALQFLAEKAGVKIPEPDDANYRKEEQLRKRLKEALLEAARYYYKNFKSEKGEAARAYLKKRAIAPATATKFGLGYAPDEWSGLYDHLVSKGFSQYEIQKSGLFVTTKNNKTIDLFRGRLMFPIFNAMGELIAFGGRIIGDGNPKYVNSPETPVYSKQRNLYALNFAKQSKMKQIIVVEGYMDVISMHQAGVTNAVASLGTALTERQLDLLERYCEEVVLFYDSDRAGQNAAVRGLKMLMERKKKHTGMTTRVRVAKVPNGKDPDEFIREYGKDEFAKVVESAVSVLDYLVDSAYIQSQESGEFDPIKFQQLISTYLSWEDNLILRERAAYKAAQILGVSSQSVMTEAGKRSDVSKKEKIDQSNRDIKKQEEILPEKQISETATRDELVLICLLASLGDKYADFVSNYGEEPLETDFSMGSMRQIVKLILPDLKAGKLDSRKLLAAGDNLILNQRPANDTLSEALMSVKYGDNVEDLMKNTLDYLYRVRMSVYTRQKDVLARRLDVMAEGPDRDATESLLRSTLSYLTELKKKMGKR